MAKNIVICSGKGGAGKSTVAVQLMRVLVSSGKRVLLMDGDVGLRCLDLLLGISDGVYDWLDVIEERATVEDALCHGEQDKGAALLMPPRSLETLPTAEAIREMLNLAGKQFDYCFLDAPAGLYGLVPVLAEAADEALLVTTPDAVSCRAAATLAESLYTLCPELPQKLLINRYDYDRVRFGYALSADQMVTEIGAQLLGAVPEDETLSAVCAGAKLHKKTQEAYQRIAKRLCGEAVPFKEKKIKSVGF